MCYVWLSNMLQSKTLLDQSRNMNEAGAHICGQLFKGTSANHFA